MEQRKLQLMLSNFQSYISDNQLFTKKNTILLAVSGGLDSVVMTQLFLQSKYKFGIAHCNFKLRKEESEKDAVFVQKMAEKMNVPFYKIDFETEKIAKARVISIQLAARELRYNWLEKIRIENKFDFITTAHHLNDSIETAIYNFTKGTGIRGLLGVPQKNGKIIRPLLFATRTEIEEFAKKEKLICREDISNSETKYARNKIRHQVIPVLKELNPSLEKTMNSNFSILQETEKLHQFAIKHFAEKIFKKRGENWELNKRILLLSPAPLSVLFHILKKYFFNKEQCQDILQNIGNQSGATYFSESYKILNNRKFLILAKKENSGKVNFIINNLIEFSNLKNLKFSTQLLVEIPEEFPKNQNIAFFDFEKLKFPIIIRNWENGDKFCPIGMKGKHQKLQDYFSNNKISRFEKGKVLIMESEGKICWIVSHRSDERFKIDENSKQILQITFEGFS